MSTTPLEIIIKGKNETTPALKEVQQELAKTATAAQKTDSSLATIGKSVAPQLNNLSSSLKQVGASAIQGAAGTNDFAGAMGGMNIATDIVIGALFAVGVGLYKYITSASEAEKTQAALNKTMNDAAASTAADVTELQTLVIVARDASRSTAERQAAIDNIFK